jgi:hypothetical protein
MVGGSNPAVDRGGRLVLVLSDDPLVVAFLTARVDRPGLGANIEKSVFTAVTAGSGTGALLGEGKLHPEAAKQLDCTQADAVQNHQRNNRENTGKIFADKLDDGDKQEAAHQATDQPGKAQIELSFMPAMEFLMLHEPVLHASVLGKYKYIPVVGYFLKIFKFPILPIYIIELLRFFLFSDCFNAGMN